MTEPEHPSAVTRHAGLTDRQEAFAQAYVRLGNGAEAYRLAYGASMRRKHLGECGRRLRKLPKVAARIEELHGGEPTGRGDALAGRQEAAERQTAAGRGVMGLSVPAGVLGAPEADAVPSEAPTRRDDLAASVVAEFADAGADAMPAGRQEAAERQTAAGRGCHGVSVPAGVLGAPEADAASEAARAVADIESAAAVALDDAAPDDVRLVALLVVTMGLRRLGSLRPGPFSVTCTIKGRSGADKEATPAPASRMGGVTPCSA